MEGYDDDGLALRDLITEVEEFRYQAHVSEVGSILSDFAAEFDNSRSKEPKSMNMPIDHVSVPHEALLALLDTIGARFDSPQSWAEIARNLQEDRDTLMNQNAALEKCLNEVVERHTQMRQASRDLRG